MRNIFANKSFWLRIYGVGILLGLIGVMSLLSLPSREAHAQQPTGSIATVTGTPRGAYVTVYSDLNQIGVFSGPSFDSYAQIGILVSGQNAPALGRSTDEKWIQIRYMGVPGGKGWIYALYVSLNAETLPFVDSPSTPTPRTTPTIDPTYVALFGLNLEPTQLPTFTSPPALEIPTFAPAEAAGSRLPFGLIILGLILIGALGAIVSFLRGQR